MNMAHLDVNRLLVQMVSVDRIAPNPYNPARDNPKLVKQIAEDIERNGIHSIESALLFKPKKIPLPKGRDLMFWDGESRWKAVKLLKLPKMDARIDPKMTDDEAIALMYRKNNERNTIDPIKEAFLFAREAGPGKPKTYKEVAEEFNVTEDYVKHSVMLTKLVGPVRRIVSHDTFFTPSHMEIIATLSPKDQLKATLEIKERELPVKEARDYIENNYGSKNPLLQTSRNGPIQEPKPPMTPERAIEIVEKAEEMRSHAPERPAPSELLGESAVPPEEVSEAVLKERLHAVLDCVELSVTVVCQKCAEKFESPNPELTVKRIVNREKLQSLLYA